MNSSDPPVRSAAPLKPDCLHRFAYDICRLACVCKYCDYVVTDADIANEGGPSR